MAAILGRDYISLRLASAHAFFAAAERLASYKCMSSQSEMVFLRTQVAGSYRHSGVVELQQAIWKPIPPHYCHAGIAGDTQQLC